MSDNVKSFPRWKRRNCPADEKLRELAEYATRKPEDVTDLLVIWLNKDGEICCESNSDQTIATAVWMLERIKFNLMNEIST
jgi:hypothetical protein